MKVHPLTEYRTRAKLSGAAFARLAGTTRATISRVEKWQISPRLDLISRMIDASGGALRADDFLPNRADQ